MKAKRKFLALVLASVLAMGSATTVLAGASYTLFGNASVVSGGVPGNAAQLISDDVDITIPHAGVDLASTTVTTLSSLTYLGTDYQMTEGDCGGGSPRFSIRVPAGLVFLFVGPAPNYRGCAAGWQTTDNLLDLWVDARQIGGKFYDTWENALALAGDSPVESIDVVIDGNWSQPDKVQSAMLDNIRINSDVIAFDLVTPADRNACMKEGWQGVTRADGTAFRNQGDCIWHVRTRK